jgi:hypothetical protein
VAEELSEEELLSLVSLSHEQALSPIESLLTSLS